MRIHPMKLVSDTQIGAFYGLSLPGVPPRLFCADRECAPALEEWAHIFGLSVAQDSIGSVTTFVTHGNGPDGTKSRWTVHDLPAVRIHVADGFHPIICEVKHPHQRGRLLPALRQSMQIMYSEVAIHGGFPVHAALAECNGAGVLLVGGEGTGKTTCCERIPKPWRVLCDDLTLVLPAGNNGYYAHPLPTWSRVLTNREPPGPSWSVEKGVPIAGFCFLEKADHNEIVPMGQGRAAVMLNAAASYVCSMEGLSSEAVLDRSSKVVLFDNTCRAVRCVPAFILRTTLNGDFRTYLDDLIP